MGLGNRLAERPRDVLKPRDSRLAYQLKWLEQGFRLERRTKDGKKEGVYVQGITVPITKGEFERLCDFHDEGTIQSARPDCIDEIRKERR